MLFAAIVGISILFLGVWAFFQFSVVRQGFRTLVPVYLEYEYLLLPQVKKLLCV
jgi:hypothetical protein